MDIFQTLTLAIVQGITEFLPISSSAHLILIPKLIGWQDQGLLFDVSLHIGTLIAVISYFFDDIKRLITEGVDSVLTNKLNSQSKLFFAIGFATVPVGLAGLAFHDLIEFNFRSYLIIAVSSIVFGLALFFGEKIGCKNRDEYDLNWRDVLLIGIAQAFALIPGASRSGTTMTAGLFLGLTRKAAARFSFLLSIPVILLSGGLKIFELLNNTIHIDFKLLIIGIIISFVTAFFCINYFLKIIDKIGMLPFIIYRIILGFALIGVYYFA